MPSYAKHTTYILQAFNYVLISPVYGIRFPDPSSCPFLSPFTIHREYGGSILAAPPQG